MNIGQAAQSSGVSAKMIRHYEDIGLIKKASRSTSGYRVYSKNDLHILVFVRQARNLGFSIEQIRELLDLWQNKRRTSRKVKELALKHIQELNVRIKELQDIQQAISHLVNNCHGDDRPECPIIDSLTDPTQQPGYTGNNKKFGLKNEPI
jgi:MerR family copper efflux transcriptional regulator